MTIPDHMLAAVYRGRNDLRVEEVPVPEIEDGEVLVRVAGCGLASSDIRDVTLGLGPAPRILGHEAVGTIVEVADDVDHWDVGDRVAVYYRVADRMSWYSQRGLYTQCPQYGDIGTTAGFEPAGGGFAEYMRVLPWVVEGEGLVPLPDDVHFEDAVFLGPVNACLKGIRKLNLDEEHTVLVAGMGSFGLIMQQLAIREGADVIAADPVAERLETAEELGAIRIVSPTDEDLYDVCAEFTDGRGADRAIVAAAGAGPIRDAVRATRPGAVILLLAQSHRGVEVAVDVGDLCLDEKIMLGSAGVSLDEAEEAAEIVFDGQIETEPLVSHRVSLEDFPRIFDLAASSDTEALKVIVVPGEDLDES